MSLYDFRRAIELHRDDEGFCAMLMALCLKASTENLAKLRAAWPEVCDEVYARYNAPGGLLPGEPAERDEDEAASRAADRDRRLYELDNPDNYRGPDGVLGNDWRDRP